MQTKNLEKTTEKKTTKQSKNNSKERLKKKTICCMDFKMCFFFLTAELRSRSKNNKKIR